MIQSQIHRRQAFIHFVLHSISYHPPMKFNGGLLEHGGARQDVHLILVFAYLSQYHIAKIGTFFSWVL